MTVTGGADIWGVDKHHCGSIKGCMSVAFNISAISRNNADGGEKTACFARVLLLLPETSVSLTSHQLFIGGREVWKFVTYANIALGEGV